MKVERVTSPDGRSSWIEPELDPKWSNLDQLRWHAASASFDTGLRIEVDATNKFPRTFMVTIAGHVGHSDRPFRDAWTLINGIESGASAVLRRAAAR